ncbi:MAG: hypothetical protein ACKVII_01335 [Planctomycetales bacterium]|jgi:hypothetical protein
MNAIDFVKLSLENSRGWAMGLITDMKDSPMTAPTAQRRQSPAVGAWSPCAC